MRDDESRHLNHVPTIQNQVEIERPRRADVRTLAAETPLDGPESGKHRGRGERRLANGGRIEEERLRRFDANRFGFVEGRNAEVGDSRREPPDCAAKLVLPVAEVAAEGDRDAR